MRKSKRAGSFIGRRKDEKRTKRSHIQPSRPPLASGKESKRDLRLDTLRGILLVIMTFVHFPSYIGNFFRQALGYVSAAEGFIFLSAYLFSFVHARQGGNLKDLFVIGLRRAFLIYRYYFLLVLIQFLLVSIYIMIFTPGQVNTAILFKQALSGILRELFFIHQPRLVNILPMYCVFVFLSPLVLYAFLRRRAVWVFVVSTGLWVLGQYKNPLEWLATQFPGSEGGYFNWIAFQFLWIGGMYLGFLHYGGKTFSWIRNKLLIGIIFILAAVLFLSRHGWLILWFDAQQAADRPDFGWLMLLNFSLMVAIVSYVLHYIPKNRGLPFFGFIGKYSLQVFAYHIFLFFLLMPLRPLTQGPAGEHFRALLAVAVVASLCFPALIQRRLEARLRQ